MQVFSALTNLSRFSFKSPLPLRRPARAVVSDSTPRLYPGCSVDEAANEGSEEPPGSSLEADSEPPDPRVLPATENHQQANQPLTLDTPAESIAPTIIGELAPPTSQPPQSFKSRLLDGFLNFGLAPQILVYVTAALIFRSATMPITVSNLLGRALSWVQIKRNSQPYLVAVNLFKPSEADQTKIEMLMSSATDNAGHESLADVKLSDLVMVEELDDLGIVPLTEESSLPPADTLVGTDVTDSANDTASGVNDCADPPPAADSANDTVSSANPVTITVTVVDIYQASLGHER